MRFIQDSSKELLFEIIPTHILDKGGQTHTGRRSLSPPNPIDISTEEMYGRGFMLVLISASRTHALTYKSKHNEATIGVLEVCSG